MQFRREVICTHNPRCVPVVDVCERDAIEKNSGLTLGVHTTIYIHVFAD